MWTRSVMRPSSALHKRALGITWGHSEKGRFVVRITVAFSARSAMTWKRNSAPRSAFTMKSTNRPWRIYIVDRDTGAMHEAVQGNDSQGGPSWSPDGRFLFYGAVHANICTTALCTASI